MKRTLSILSLFALFLSVICCSQGKTADGIARPTAKQVEWANQEIGVLIHFDMPVFKPEYNWREWGTHPDPSTFNPTNLDTDQWIQTAKSLGAGYAILVAKHCSGFSLWPTEAHDYSVRSSSWMDGQGDVVRNFVESCRKYGVKPGIYASTSANGYLRVDAHKLQEGSPVTLEEYNQIVTKQLTELWGNYGELFEVWFDGGLLSLDKGGADVLGLVQKLQPDAIAFQGPFGHENLIRWVGNEEGVAPYPCWATTDSLTNADGTVVVEGLNGDPDAPFWCPGESDFTLRWNDSFQGGWFWTAGEDDKMFTLEEMMKKYETSVGRNTNMLLGMVIDDRGMVPDKDAQRIRDLGKAIQEKYGHPLSCVSGRDKELTIDLKEPTAIDRLVLQEEIQEGERVLSYEVQGLENGVWVTLSEGTNIGHKHIDIFPVRTVSKVRLTVKQAKAKPVISNFAVYSAL